MANTKNLKAIEKAMDYAESLFANDKTKTEIIDHLATRGWNRTQGYFIAAAAIGRYNQKLYKERTKSK